MKRKVRLKDVAERSGVATHFVARASTGPAPK